MHEEAGSIRWATRVPPNLIARFYEADAEGLLGDDVIAEVGYQLFERCRDIVIASQAMTGAATCPRCDTKIEHDARSRTWLECSCGFRMRWSAYARSFRDRWLRGGRAMPYFEAFVDAWPRARTRREKVLAIDAVVHAIHADAADARHGRHAAASVIEATDADARALLDRLAGNDRWRSVDRRRIGP